MPEIYSSNALPRAAVVGLGALLVGTVLAVAGARLTGVEVADDLSAPVQERQLRFEDLADGGVAVRDAKDGQVLERIEPGSNHFLRAIMRGLVRERMRRGEGDEVPFQLARRVDGRLTLIDPVTNRVVDLGAFGTSNSGVFAEFLSPSSASPVRAAALHTVQGVKP